VELRASRWVGYLLYLLVAREDGMSDYNCIDVIREARATVVAAAQSSTSFIPPLGREKARVFTLNLRNRLIFKAADEEGFRLKLLDNQRSRGF
jgi:hypothetical protein